ncbi:MAG TPA: response regulator [Chloroflexia bacterium]|nr:response regulator [Chloroflexia bacterium]
MAAPRILIVDDQRDITRMLRAALETLGRGYVIIDVPSAEEAQLEFRRGPVDLLVTDLRLPGISGLELVRRLHKASSEARMFVISAYADETTQAELKRLGATFFAKPLSLEDFLIGVQSVLGARAAEGAAAPAAAEEPANLSARMARLRRDLGALAVLLVDLQHRVTEETGGAPGLDIAGLLAPLMAAFSASLEVSAALGGRVPANFHFFDGSAYDIYTANVGLAYALVIVFDSQGGVAQTGPVLRYARQCADDLLNLLRERGAETGPAQLARPINPPAGAKPPAPVAKTPPLRMRRPSNSAPTPILSPQPDRPAPAPTPPLPPVLQPGPPLTPEEIAALEAVAGQVTSQAADAFWESSLEDAPAPDERDGMISYEQASKLGLIPPKA